MKNADSRMQNALSGLWVGQYFKSALMILVTLQVLYLLSVGPVNWACIKFNVENYNGTSAMVRRIYSPLEKLYASDSMAARIYKSYLRFWTPKNRPKVEVPPVDSMSVR
jgi:hypothetical protein